MKTNKADINDSLPKFTENFNLLVEELLKRNEPHLTKLKVEDLRNTTNELVEFEEEFSQVIY